MVFAPFWSGNGYGIDVDRFGLETGMELLVGVYEGKEKLVNSK